MFEFAGWRMPLQYSSIVVEHFAVRRDVGLFDVSHMGKMLVSGASAWESLNRLSANDVPRKAGRARYTHLLDEDGRIIDDVIITCLAPDQYLMVCNAEPRERVLAWIRKGAKGQRVEDLTFDYLCLALQGPKAARVMQLVTTFDVNSIKTFGASFCDLLLGERLGTSRPRGPVPQEMMGWGAAASSMSQEVADFCLVTRTGYTGEDGFELFPPSSMGMAVWNALLAAGREAGIRPVGLGARDTLRLERGFLLSGTDFDGRQTPLEASSEWLVKWDHEFIGREALRRQKERGGYDRLVGLRAMERGVPRHGCPVVQGDRPVGVVTSGTVSPSLKIGIALAYVRPQAAGEGTHLAILVRDRPVRAEVKKPPFL